VMLYPSNGDGAGLGAVKPLMQLMRLVLPAPVGADDGHQFPGVDVEIDVDQRPESTKREVESGDFQLMRHGHSPGCFWHPRE